jgi:hypothetical protein
LWYGLTVGQGVQETMAKADELQKAPRRPDREGRSALAAWVNREGFFTFQELLLRLSRERGAKITIQDALVEAMNDFGRKHGIDLNLS